MFCYQCEQTDRSGLIGDHANLLAGCSGHKGNCGKDETTAGMQDLLIYVTLGLGQYAHRLRALGKPDPQYAYDASYYFFTTLTNVNFNTTRFVTLITEATKKRDAAKAAYDAACAEAGQIPEPLRGPATFETATTTNTLIEQFSVAAVDRELGEVGADVVGLRALNLYGLKGLCAYAHHAHVLGYRDEVVDAGVEEALNFLADPPADVEALLAHAITIGEVNLAVMAMLDAANTGVFGTPTPTAVRVTPRAGHAILVSGHDLGDLQAILAATDGQGVDVYTHGEMLPAHGYPGLHAYPHLAGNYGGAWQDQHQDFGAFPGPIVMTSNCLIEPQPGYKRRIFTLGPTGWPGVRHLEHKDLDVLVKAAKALPGFKEDAPEQLVTTGFARDAVLDHAATVVEAVKSGQISRFFVIGGCDGAVPGRNYYTDVATKAPEDTVLLTMGCNKYRFNKLEFGTVAGLPRLLDCGQCNDAYSALRIAMALAEAFDCDVNDLPLSLFVSWFEQKAAAVLLTMLALGLQNIRLGPTLPAFLTPAAMQVLVERFNLKANGDPTRDLEEAMAGR